MIKNFLNKFGRKRNTFMLYAFCDGEIVELEDVRDEVFSSGMLGKGVAIEPRGNKIYAPTSGTVTNVFETQHALNIVSDFGCEILIHIGIDTVKLRGKFFNMHVKEGDSVNKGDILCTFDNEGIKSSGLKITTPMVVCNTDNYSQILPRPSCKIKKGDSILRIET